VLALRILLLLPGAKKKESCAKTSGFVFSFQVKRVSKEGNLGPFRALNPLPPVSIPPAFLRVFGGGEVSDRDGNF